MKIPLECRAIPVGTSFNSQPRLIFSGGLWDEWDLEFCIHGEKLRWGCDHCEEHFEANPDQVPPEE